MRVVMITGATRNTGLAIARRFASEGWQVVITSRDGASAQATANALSQEFSVKAKGYELCLTNVESIVNVFQQIYADFGRLDTFVANSADLGVGYGVINTTEDALDAIFDVNVKGTFFCCQEAARLMIDSGGGSIVTMGSVQGTGAVEGRAIYGMTKAALSQLVKSMAFELGHYSIRANNIVAGAIHSDRWDILSPEELAQRRSKYPAGRESTEQEIANAAYFLGSSQSATITGTDLTIDSGLSVCLLPYQKRGE